MILLAYFMMKVKNAFNINNYYANVCISENALSPTLMSELFSHGYFRRYEDTFYLHVRLC